MVSEFRSITDWESFYESDKRIKNKEEFIEVYKEHLRIVKLKWKRGLISIERILNEYFITSKVFWFFSKTGYVGFNECPFVGVYWYLIYDLKRYWGASHYLELYSEDEETAYLMIQAYCEVVYDEGD